MQVKKHGCIDDKWYIMLSNLLALSLSPPPSLQLFEVYLPSCTLHLFWSFPFLFLFLEIPKTNVGSGSGKCEQVARTGVASHKVVSLYRHFIFCSGPPPKKKPPHLRRVWTELRGRQEKEGKLHCAKHKLLCEWDNFVGWNPFDSYKQWWHAEQT